MAFEVTKLVHGEEEALKVEQISKEVFSGLKAENMPSITLNESNLNILDLLVKTNLAPSKSEARRLVEQGGISINNMKIIDTNHVNGEKIVVQKRQKHF